MESKKVQRTDVIIVGAGISGISAACHLHKECPDKSYVILESRRRIGGTWDLFRYPGIRSDSDMHTFGIRLKPWNSSKSLADGSSILKYLGEAVQEYQIEPHIHFENKVSSAAWNTTTSTWTVTSLNGSNEARQYEARLLFMCNGYYNYEEGYRPEIPGLKDFKGTLVHPQHWPRNLDYKNQKVAVIGSGATAVTLIPAMARDVERITMIQRSPSYILSRPNINLYARLLNRLLPKNWAYGIIRWYNIFLQNYFYKRSHKKPEKIKAWLLNRVRKELGQNCDVDKHFTPRYNPWTQRLCLVPDSDLFKAINSGKADVVTGLIERITENGVLMDSGKLIECDILITATGLQMQLLGRIEFFQDAKKIDFTQHFYYQGMMFSGISNLIQTLGYINSSWTLRADLNSRFVCSILKKMDATGTAQCVPLLRESERDMPVKDWLSDFSPGYFLRAAHLFPKQSNHSPWYFTHDYLLDRKLLRKGPANDGVLRFLKAGQDSTSRQ